MIICVCPEDDGGGKPCLDDLVVDKPDDQTHGTSSRPIERGTDRGKSARSSEDDPTISHTLGRRRARLRDGRRLRGDDKPASTQISLDGDGRISESTLGVDRTSVGSRQTFRFATRRSASLEANMSGSLLGSCGSPR
jgi:hypothetical protein